MQKRLIEVILPAYIRTLRKAECSLAKHNERQHKKLVGREFADFESWQFSNSKCGCLQRDIYVFSAI